MHYSSFIKLLSYVMHSINPFVILIRFIVLMCIITSYRSMTQCLIRSPFSRQLAVSVPLKFKLSSNLTSLHVKSGSKLYVNMLHEVIPISCYRVSSYIQSMSVGRLKWILNTHYHVMCLKIK